MSRATLGAGALFFAIFLVASGCFQPIDRPANAAPTTITTEPTPSPTQMPTSTATITPSETPVPSPTSTPATPEPTVTVAILETATPTVTPTPNGPEPTNTPEPTVEPEPTATATFAPQPTSTFTPVPTPGDNLFLEVLGPIDGQTVQVESILVYGFTKPGAAVRINQNQITASPGGQFQRIVQLSEGVNRLEVVASNGTEPDQTKILNVTRLPQQPFILIVTRPANFSVVNRSPIQVIGVTSPHAIVSVNGVTINVDLGGIFQTEIALRPDELNNVDVIATNVDGEVKSTRISVFYSPS